MPPFGRLALVVLSGAIAQVGVFSPLPIAGVRPMVLLLIAVAGGAALGAERGAVVGFAAGLVFDLLLTTPIGLCALVFCVAAYLTGRLAPPARRPSWWRAPVVVGAASAGAWVGLRVTGWILGQRGMVPDRPLVGVAVVALVNAAGAPFALRALRWAGSPVETTPWAGSPDKPRGRPPRGR
jgi:rod shape-determining protein MreD